MRRDVGGVSLFLVHDSNEFKFPPSRNPSPGISSRWLCSYLLRKDGSLLAGAELYLSLLGMGLGLVLVLAMFELYHPLLLGVFIGI